MRRRAIDSMTVRVPRSAPVPATTAAGIRAHQHRSTAETGRLLVVRRRGARVKDPAKFARALEIEAARVADQQEADCRANGDPIGVLMALGSVTGALCAFLLLGYLALQCIRFAAWGG